MIASDFGSRHSIECGLASVDEESSLAIRINKNPIVGNGECLRLPKPIRSESTHCGACGSEEADWRADRPKTGSMRTIQTPRGANPCPSLRPLKTER